MCFGDVPKMEGIGILLVWGSTGIRSKNYCVGLEMYS
jgi:hypothetical protein